MIDCRTVEPPSQPPTPPSCSDCATKTQAAGGQPTQTASRMWRSSSGNMRIDTPNTSMITIPASQKAILLDHLKKEAMVIPIPPAQAAPPPSGSSQSSAGPAPPPPMQVQDLGKSTIEGHEVEGKRYILSLPQIPQLPQKPQPPKPPQSASPQPPTTPPAPKLPQPPKPPQPNVTEIWTSIKLKMPVLTKVTTAAGEQTTYCKPTSTAEPHPSLFEIPPGYKLQNPKQV